MNLESTEAMVTFGEELPEPKKVGDFVEFEEGGLLYFDLETLKE